MIRRLNLLLFAGCPEGLQGEAGEDSSQLGHRFSQVLADQDILMLNERIPNCQIIHL